MHETLYTRALLITGRVCSARGRALQSRPCGRAFGLPGVLRPHAHWMRRAKRSKLGHEKPIVTTELFTLQAASNAPSTAMHQATSIRMGPGSIFSRGVSRVASSVHRALTTQTSVFLTRQSASRSQFYSKKKQTENFNSSTSRAAKSQMEFELFLPNRHIVTTTVSGESFAPFGRSQKSSVCGQTPDFFHFPLRSIALIEEKSNAGCTK